MLDIKYLRDNPDEARRRLATRGRGDEAHVDTLLAQDESRRALLVRVESLKAERNKASKEIGARKAKKEPTDDLMAAMKTVSDEIAGLDVEVAAVEAAQEALLLTIPNFPHATVPVGDDAAANRTERTHGAPASFPFAPKNHIDLAALSGLLDFERAAKISGSGFLVFKGKGARLERALISYLLDFHTEAKAAPGLDAYVEVSPPFLVRGEAMKGTGQLPKFADDMYKIEGEDLYLIPTAEVPVTNLHAGEIVPAEALPIRYAAYTPCFRKEAGSAGKDTRGMIRVHQFDKVELVQIVRPEDSYAALDRLVAQVEAVLQSLGLHYRVLTLSTGDMGFGAAKCHDIEVWAPGLGTWLEVSSCSNFEDFQARRMGLKYKDAEGKNRFCHTLNGSGTALARLFIALVETHQQDDGRVLLPEKLRSYMGADFI
ncbi:seryl-tRNA synthetase [Verrucomicrobium sp. GAS474]|uniref:serine--tRNA ligase n=1 Tax=Verrucomicrobium sp. GAS474 TaxID=1882831 RepID=UPI00087C3FE4|nr:serine--tRNA ligase [Verrucomicrobium sp. GAS474]SDT87438.1 seryl-tRNA synthetase [Verrucomicrobium sp. GAS474]